MRPWQAQSRVRAEPPATESLAAAAATGSLSGAGSAEPAGPGSVTPGAGLRGGGLGPGRSARGAGGQLEGARAPGPGSLLSEPQWQLRGSPIMIQIPTRVTGDHRTLTGCQ